MIYVEMKNDLLRFEVYILIVLKDSPLSKTMNRATAVCAAKCFIANINEFYGRLCSLFHWKCFTEQLKRTLGS